MKFKKILVTGFSRSSLDENIWTKISKISEKIVFEPSAERERALTVFFQDLTRSIKT